MFHALYTNATKKLAYELALRNEKNMPPSWHENKEAGSDWLAGFMKRNETVSLRKPEATSIGRTIGFNRVSIGIFFANLEVLLVKHEFGPAEIYNLDEAGTSTVQTPDKVIASTGIKQSGFRVSGVFRFNKDVFGEDEFLAAIATDQPAPDESEPPPHGP